MQIVLYTNFSDNRYLSKNITKIMELSCHVKDACSVESPRVVLTDVLGGKLSICNYAYIQDFTRYYYIKDIVADTAGRIELQLQCDVLMTYAGQIRSMDGVILRQEFLNNKKIVDDYAPVRTERVISYKKIGSLKNGIGFALTVAGGGVANVDG